MDRVFSSSTFPFCEQKIKLYFKQFKYRQPDAALPFELIRSLAEIAAVVRIFGEYDLLPIPNKSTRHILFIHLYTYSVNDSICSSRICLPA